MCVYIYTYLLLTDPEIKSIEERKEKDDEGSMHAPFEKQLLQEQSTISNDLIRAFQRSSVPLNDAICTFKG